MQRKYYICDIMLLCYYSIMLLFYYAIILLCYYSIMLYYILLTSESAFLYMFIISGGDSAIPLIVSPRANGWSVG